MVREPGHQGRAAWAQWHGGQARPPPRPNHGPVGLRRPPTPHAQHHVDVAAHTPSVGSHEVGLGGLQALLLDVWPHGGDDLVLLIHVVEVGNVARVQDVVNVLQEGLILDLGESRVEELNLDDGPGVWGSTTLVSLDLSNRPLPRTVPLGSEKPRVTQVTSRVVVEDSHPDPPCSRDSEHRCLAMEGPGSWVGHAVSSSSLAGTLHISQLTHRRKPGHKQKQVLPISYGQGPASARRHPLLPDYVREAPERRAGLAGSLPGFQFRPNLKCQSG